MRDETRLARIDRGSNGGVPSMISSWGDFALLLPSARAAVVADFGICVDVSLAKPRRRRRADRTMIDMCDNWLRVGVLS